MKRAHRLTAGGLAVSALFGANVAMSLQVLGAGPAQQTADQAVLPPCPSPLGALVPGVTCTLVGTINNVTNSPPPVAGPILGPGAPVAGPTGSGAPGAVGGQPADAAPPAAAPAAPAPADAGVDTTGVPASTMAAARNQAAAAAAGFENQALLRQLLDILAHPVTGQRPDLRHFAPGGGSGPPNPLATANGGGEPSQPLRPLVPILGGLIAALICGILLTTGRGQRALIAVLTLSVSPRDVARSTRRGLARAGHRVRHPLPPLAWRRLTRRRVALATLLGLLPVLAGAAVVNQARAVSPAPAAHSGGGDVSTRPDAYGAPSRHPGWPAYELSEPANAKDVEAENAKLAARAASLHPWAQLVSIEQGISTQHDSLVQQEQQIDTLSREIGHHQQASGSTNPNPGSSPGGDPRTGTDSQAQKQQQLTNLIAQHQQAQAAYEKSLQDEYMLYRQAAIQPAVLQQILAQASTDPAARQAVSYNLSLVQAQVQQEQQIADAQAKLQQLGVLSQAQLSALAQGQHFLAPEAGPVTQIFGPTDFTLEPPLVYNGKFYPNFHTGADIGAPFGTPVHSAADGIVTLVQQSGVGYGNHVVIAHPDGFTTLYGHLSHIDVQQGQVLHQGDVIGEEGSTGFSTGPHLHFEIRYNNLPVDPALFIADQLPGLHPAALAPPQGVPAR